MFLDAKFARVSTEDFRPLTDVEFLQISMGRLEFPNEEFLEVSMGHLPLSGGDRCRSLQHLYITAANPPTEVGDLQVVKG